jgi:hypothetical protein
MYPQVRVFEPWVSQTTQFDHHGTSVFAINTNHHLAVQFFFVTMYPNCHEPIVSVAPFNHLNEESPNGSLGILDIHAPARS